MIYHKRNGVFFRRIAKGDLDELYIWRNDPQIRRWCRQKDLLHWRNHERWFEWQAEDSATSMYMICPHKGGAVGVCGLTSINHFNRHAEFSMYVATKEQRKGYGKDALKLLFHHGFNDLNLKTIWGETIENNPAQLMFESVGMKKEGVLRSRYFKDGEYLDSLMYSITKRELDPL